MNKFVTSSLLSFIQSFSFKEQSKVQHLAPKTSMSNSVLNMEQTITRKRPPPHLLETTSVGSQQQTDDFITSSSLKHNTSDISNTLKPIQLQKQDFDSNPHKLLHKTPATNITPNLPFHDLLAMRLCRPLATNVAVVWPVSILFFFLPFLISNQLHTIFLK